MSRPKNEDAICDMERLLRQRGEGWTAEELAAALEVSQRTVYVYLQELVDNGLFVYREGISRPSRYRIGRSR